ncbi:MAG: class I tRNA ligase family protein [Chloroflexi bacterium]|nr:class I tRNA ligase family protein [Chloroflexota bacterium]
MVGEQRLSQPAKCGQTPNHSSSPSHPNVTGELHGHAMFVALEDLMIRHARMKGLAALWLRARDHAGIATQLQVEKALAKGSAVSRLGVRRFWSGPGPGKKSKAATSPSSSPPGRVLRLGSGSGLPSMKVIKRWLSHFVRRTPDGPHLPQ